MSQHGTARILKINYTIVQWLTTASLAWNIQGLPLWQPALRLVNALTAGHPRNEAMSPHTRIQAPITLKYQWKEGRREVGEFC